MAHDLATFISITLGPVKSEIITGKLKTSYTTGECVHDQAVSDLKSSHGCWLHYNSIGNSIVIITQKRNDQRMMKHTPVTIRTIPPRKGLHSILIPKTIFIPVIDG